MQSILQIGPAGSWVGLWIWTCNEVNYQHGCIQRINSKICAMQIVDDRYRKKSEVAGTSLFTGACPKQNR